MKAKEICNEIAKEVKQQMQACIELGDDTMYYEKEYGDAFVAVDIKPIRMANGFWLTITDVAVCHGDTRHESPLLTAAIKAAIPDWDKMEQEYKNSGWYRMNEIEN